MAALDYWIWLSAGGVSARTLGAVLAHFGAAEQAFLSPPGAIAAIEGVNAREAALLERRDLRALDRILGECERQQIRPVTLQDAAYPARLKNLFAPPPVLYVKGDPSLVDREALIAVIGTRRATPYGLRMSRELAWEISAGGGLVLSLLSSGVDMAAAKAALQSGGRCVGVLATPHVPEANDLVRDVAARGLLITEYPPGTETRREHFRERNRLAAGLCVGVVVVEAPEKSGTRLFVREAAEQGKEIFAVPGNADAASSAGTLGMLKEGAKLVTCGWDVLEEFAPLFPGKLREPKGEAPKTAEEPERENAAAVERRAPEPEKKSAAPPPDLRRQLESLSAEQLRIVTAIGAEIMHIDDIIEKTQLPTATVMSQATVLTVKGFLIRHPGQRYQLNVNRGRGKA